MTYEDLILDRTYPGAVYTTSALTEILFRCRELEKIIQGDD